jgi:hypothetical protein
MSSNATLAIRNLVTKLGTVGTVRTGRAALETTSADLPVMTVRSLGDAPAAKQIYDDRSYTRRVGIEAVLDVSTTAAYHEALDDRLSAIRAVIIPDAITGVWLGGYALMVRENSARWLYPADNSGLAVMQVELEFDYLD